MSGWFVSGTDTEIGKTLVASALVHALAAAHVRVAAMKPVAAGAEERDGVLHNEDADWLAAEVNVPLPQPLTTPYMLREAAAPHIAAQMEGVTLDLAHIVSCYQQVAAQADHVVVEGVGGFRVPLTRTEDTSDRARQLDLPVILVVGMRLGCISQALLSAEAIAARGLVLAGWVANSASLGMAHGAANVDAIAERLAAPLLGFVPRLAQPSAALAAAHIDFSRLAGWPVAQLN